MFLKYSVNSSIVPHYRVRSGDRADEVLNRRLGDVLFAVRHTRLTLIATGIDSRYNEAHEPPVRWRASRRKAGSTRRLQSHKEPRVACRLSLVLVASLFASAASAEEAKR